MKNTILLTLALACITNGEVNSILSEARMNNALFNYLMQSASYLTNPTVSVECLGRHLPMLSDIAERFSQQYQECIMVANNLTAALAVQAMQSRNVLQTDMAQMCDAYQCCEHEKDALDFFDCYVSASAQHANVVSNISHKACYAANTYSQSLKIIQEECIKCTNESEKTYVTRTADIYRRLDDCLKQGLDEAISRNNAATCDNNDESSISYKQPENFIPLGLSEEITSTIPGSCEDPDEFDEATTVATSREFRAFTNYKTKDPALEFMIRSMFPRRTMH